MVSENKAIIGDQRSSIVEGIGKKLKANGGSRQRLGLCLRLSSSCGQQLWSSCSLQEQPETGAKNAAQLIIRRIDEQIGTTLQQQLCQSITTTANCLIVKSTTNATTKTTTTSKQSRGKWSLGGEGRRGISSSQLRRQERDAGRHSQSSAWNADERQDKESRSKGNCGIGVVLVRGGQQNWTSAGSGRRQDDLKRAKVNHLSWRASKIRTPSWCRKETWAPKLPLLLLLLLLLVATLQVACSTFTTKQEQHLLVRPTSRLVSGRFQRQLSNQQQQQQQQQQSESQLGNRQPILQLPTNNLAQHHSHLHQQQQNVPYKTLYVTRACEWKSNLFVPKSNDILFAQATPHPLSSSPSSSATLNEPHPTLESSVVYETLNSYQRPQLVSLDQSGRTLFSTDSKALILTLPITMSASFAGYEPACSIRLIVPKNMRILAKLTSRRLTFAQEQLAVLSTDQEQQQDLQPPPPVVGFAPPFQQVSSSWQRQLWLNVSQNEFAETEQRVIETEGNVLAFRFLLNRFASRQQPEMRFQVIVTAFQTLGENSDLAGAGAGAVPARGRPSYPATTTFIGDPNAQFICDQQRLISANLACDGFKNCQDGQDEEQSTCAALLPPITAITATGGVELPPRNLSHGGDSEEAPVWVRIWQAARDTRSVAGFLIGFLFVLILLTCCTCCCYASFLLWRQHWPSRQARARRRDTKVQQQQQSDESASLARAQNAENAARLAKLANPLDRSQQQQLQSILKRPGRPLEPPPQVPAEIKRGALSSSLSSSSARASPFKASLPSSAADFRPTPAARRLTRPSRPPPRPSPLQQAFLDQTTSVSTGSNSNSSGRQQRVTTYHYSSGSTRYTESYLQRLPVHEPAESGNQQQQSSSDRIKDNSPSQSSLI